MQIQSPFKFRINSKAYLESFQTFTKNRGGSRTAARPKMECFVIIVNGFQHLVLVFLLLTLNVYLSAGAAISKIECFVIIVLSQSPPS